MFNQAVVRTAWTLTSTRPRLDICINIIVFNTKFIVLNTNPYLACSVNLRNCRRHALCHGDEIIQRAQTCHENHDFQGKNHDFQGKNRGFPGKKHRFLLKNHHFLLKNHHFLLKNHHFVKTKRTVTRAGAALYLTLLVVEETANELLVRFSCCNHFEYQQRCVIRPGPVPHAERHLSVKS